MKTLLMVAAGLASVATTSAFAQGSGMFGGPYIGVQVGAARIQDKHTDVDDWYNNSKNYRIEKTGVTGGVRAGYDIVSGSLIAGVLAEVSFGSLNSFSEVSSRPTNPEYKIGSKINTLGSVRAKVGVTSGNLAAFVTGGAAFADTKQKYRETDSCCGEYYDGKGKRTGYVFGVGAAYAVTPHSSIGLDISSYQFGTQNHILLASNGTPKTTSSSSNGFYNWRQRDRVDSVNLSYNFRF